MLKQIKCNPFFDVSVRSETVIRINPAKEETLPWLELLTPPINKPPVITPLHSGLCTGAETAALAVENLGPWLM